mmetsp:Transcript_57726/g.182870  ORF Transcript_57726/g.182870 Transcript_57726/m.182870 type:complete len:253 (-) Transcript_57726:458-1216(-)
MHRVRGESRGPMLRRVELVVHVLLERPELGEPVPALVAGDVGAVEDWMLCLDEGGAGHAGKAPVVEEEGGDLARRGLPHAHRLLHAGLPHRPPNKALGVVGGHWLLVRGLHDSHLLPPDVLEEICPPQPLLAGLRLHPLLQPLLNPRDHPPGHIPAPPRRTLQPEPAPLGEVNRCRLRSRLDRHGRLDVHLSPQLRWGVRAVGEGEPSSDRRERLQEDGLLLVVLLVPPLAAARLYRKVHLPHHAQCSEALL